MYKVLRADKDTYITDRLVRGTRVTGSNVGAAGTLDLFKLYGFVMSGSTPLTELSRLLVHFDLSPLRTLVSAGKLDVGSTSFQCTLKLQDVYGGQPTPNNFSVVAYPLSRSFDEGLGRDVVYYSDRDVTNYITGSRAQGGWLLSGCALGGGIPGSVDYITASTSIQGGTNLGSTQLFVTGEEDLELDVTTQISATLAGFLPDNGFRISLSASLEIDQYTYFVKRFASRTAFNEDKRPRMIVKYDDSVQDDTQNLYMDSPSYVFMYNYVRQALANVTSGSALTQITGSNSLILKLATEISGGTYNLVFTGSQHKNGIYPVTGVYSASVTVSSTDLTIASKLLQSSSIKFYPIWGSLDGKVSFVTGSAIYAFPPQRGGAFLGPKQFSVSVYGIKNSYKNTEEATLRVNVFDYTSPLIGVTKTPVELPGIVIRDVHYQVRDSVTDHVEIPFDTVKNSTRVSSDTTGMFFRLDMANLTHDRAYTIDIMITTGNTQQIYGSAGTTFKVANVR